MALRLTVSVSRKIGQPGYGSLGASCGLEQELDGALPEREPEKFRQVVQAAYLACTEAVEAELARQQAPAVKASNGTARHPARSVAATACQNGNGYDTRRPATKSQVRAIISLAHLRRVELPALLQQGYAVQNAEQLTIAEASQLIDELNPRKQSAS